MSIINALPKVRGTYRENAILANTTWFGVGGPADILFKPKDLDDLIFFLQNKPSATPITILGLGSNILVRDGGIRGVVIKLGREFSYINYSKDVILVGAATPNINLTKYCLMHSICNFEFLSGIPGCMGGAIKMNAGAYGADLSEILISAKAVDLDGKILELSNTDFGFTYRGNSLERDLIFVEAVFIAKSCDKSIIEEKLDLISQSRERSQPIKSRTSGSSFKNPEGEKAWKLIDQAGCRGLKIGDAVVSQQHCNFFINQGNASAADIENLGNKVIQMVKEKTGVTLEWEIKIIGENINAKQ